MGWYWIFTWRDQPILSSLNEDQTRKILDLLSDLPRFDWSSQELLGGIASK